MSKFIEASDALIKRIDDAISLGDYPENPYLFNSPDEDIFTDAKILCHEFGNPAIIELIGSAPTLARCRKAMEKIRDTALFRTQADS